MAELGFFVIPAGTIKSGNKRIGSRVVNPVESPLIMPDLFCFEYFGISQMWIECKRKEHASWHFKSRCWELGIDSRCILDYRRLSEISLISAHVIFNVNSPYPSDQDKNLSKRKGSVWKSLPDKAPCGYYIMPVDQPERRSYGGLHYFGIQDMVYVGKGINSLSLSHVLGGNESNGIIANS